MDDKMRMPSDLSTALTAQGFLQGSCRPERLIGGQTNRLWRIIDGRGVARVAKLISQDRDNPLFRNDPETETAMMKFLAPQNLAPGFESMVRVASGTCLLYGYVSGQTWTENTAPVARLLGKVHGLSISGLSSRTADGSTEIWQQTQFILSRCKAVPIDFEKLRPKQTVPPSGRAQFLHGDCVPGNLLETDRGLLLIDWQCPSIGDPSEDIAVFLSPAMQSIYRGMMLTAQQIREFLDAYPEPKIINQYQLLAPWYHLRMAAYCIWKTEQGVEAYRIGLEAELEQMGLAV